MILGIHCPVRAGFGAALERAAALGCASMQMLPYRRNEVPAPEDLAAFSAARGKTSVTRLLIHSRYVPSLGSSDDERRRRSIAHLANELRLAAALGGDAYVLHAGAYSEGVEHGEGLGRVAGAIVEAVGRAEASVPILLENVPGGGRRLGGTLEELAWLSEPLRKVQPAAGFCIDTAHAWAGGYDMGSAEAMLKFLSKIHRLLGADSVKAFHLNDTRALLGSHREHHEHWGRGHVRGEGLQTLLQRSEYAAAVGILETPWEAPGDDERNLAFVTSRSAS
ncbi:MAG: deoxyribonuclease IV [Elusimicrobiota bacterium]